LERRRELTRAADLYFAQGGGKGELATLAAAYTQLRTRTAVIADLDLLRNEAELAKVVEALGHDLDRWRPLLNSLRSDLASQPPITSLADLLAQARRKLEEIESVGELSATRKNELQTLLDNGAKWSEAKRYGIEKLRGGSYENAQTLLQDWQSIGLFLVPTGELEGWWHQGPANKSDWIFQALVKLDETDEIADVDRFAIAVCKWFGLT
jgi:hypothetical protein